jgi:glycine/D-amino acid oxidase-like deaminating enzyme
MAVGRCAEAIVVGAGIIGAACAWRLAQEGHQVLLVDNQRPVRRQQAWGTWSVWTIIPLNWP